MFPARNGMKFKVLKFSLRLIVGGLAVLLVSAGACVSDEAPVAADEDPAGIGFATGVGVVGSLNCTPDVL